MEEDMRRTTATQQSMGMIGIVTIITLLTEANTRLVPINPHLILIIAHTIAVAIITTIIKTLNPHLQLPKIPTRSLRLTCPIGSTTKDESYQKEETIHLLIRLRVCCKAFFLVDDLEVVFRAGHNAFFLLVCHLLQCLLIHLNLLPFLT